MVVVSAVEKQQEKMYIKTGCTVKAHKDNMWSYNTFLVSTPYQQVFIWVKSKEDVIVWTNYACV